MKDTIRFRGLTLNRDEYSCDNGEMSLCGGVEIHDGALRPSVLQGTMVNSGKKLPGKLVYIHKTDDYEMFITIVEGDNEWLLCAYKAGVNAMGSPVWEGAGPNGAEISGDSFKFMKSIKSVGNTLIVMNDAGNNQGIHYFMCRNTGNGWLYEYNGQQPPFIPLQFDLRQSSPTHWSDESTYNCPPDTPLYKPDEESDGIINEDVRASLTEHVLGKINERIDTISGDGCFYAPFLIRYCYRMYDGSMIMHSAPVLMMPILHHPVMTFSYNLSLLGIGNTDVTAITLNVFMEVCELYVRCLNSNFAYEIGKWKDIIKSVDVFITPQFSRIDTSKMIEKVGVNYTDFNYALFNGVEYIDNPSIPGLFKTTYDPNDRFEGELVSVILPEYSETDYFSRIRRASYFYKLATVNIEDIDTKFPSPSFEKLEFDASILHNIAVQTQMRDDYKTHNMLLPVFGKDGGMYVYNNRLNVYGISEKLFKGFTPQVLFPYTISAGGNIWKAITYITTDSGTYKVDSGSAAISVSQWLLKNGYVFYPDARAVAMHFSYEFFTYDVKRRLTPSDELNGSLSFMDDSLIDTLPSTVNDSNDEAVVPILNKVYTSKAENPYNFNMYQGEAAVNTIGNGEVTGLAVATRGLSSGQVGDHDLIAFCTDGIWVMKVSSAGTYSDLHNISREICINRESICQLDQSVVFATNRAFNRMVEQNIVSMSEVLDGPYFDIRKQLEAFADEYCRDFPSGQAPPADYDRDADALIRFATPPSAYYQQGKVLYDYQGRRLVILPADTVNNNVALVFSIRDEAWSTMVLPQLKAALNFYPSPYVQFVDVDPYFDGGPVMRLDTPYDYSDTDSYTGVVVTRTMAWSDTMDVLRGFRQYTDSEQMPVLFFFGSNDQRSWNYIGKSQRGFHNYIPGHPYRFFRIAMYLRMHTSEKYQALALEIINKYAKL